MTSTTGNNPKNISLHSAGFALPPVLGKLASLLLLVVVVLLLLSTLVPPHIIWSDKEASFKTAIAQLGAFRTALDMFKADNGFYPLGTNDLNDLVVKPTGAAADWHQYLDAIPVDPWGHPYLYVFPGKHNTNSYDLNSAGPDGIPGTPDDIKNW
jgi:general secretion pathway protein G